MAVTSVRMTDDEQAALKAFADFHGVPLSTLLKETLLERMEDEYDVKLAEEALAEDDGTRYTLADMRARYGLSQ